MTENLDVIICCDSLEKPFEHHSHIHWEKSSDETNRIVSLLSPLSAGVYISFNIYCTYVYITRMYMYNLDPYRKYISCLCVYTCYLILQRNCLFHIFIVWPSVAIQLRIVSTLITANLIRYILLSCAFLRCRTIQPDGHDLMFCCNAPYSLTAVCIYSYGNI